MSQILLCLSMALGDGAGFLLHCMEQFFHSRSKRRSLSIGFVLVYELIGSALTKRSLMAAGEIRPEGKTSARTVNTPKKPVVLGKPKS